MHGRIDDLANLAKEREDLVNQMALAIRNIALLHTDDGRDTRDILAIISRTESLLHRKAN